MREEFCELVASILFWSSVLLIVVVMNACAAPATFQGTWAGDSKSVSIDRAQEGKQIKCSDPQFDQYVCGTIETWSAVKNSCKSSSLP